MWSVGNRRVDLYLGTRRLQLLYRGRLLVNIACTGVDDGLDQLLARQDFALSRYRFRVWLSGGLCWPLILPEVAGAASKNDWLRIAESVVEELAGSLEPCRIWVDPSAYKPHVAVAVAESVVNRLHDAIPVRHIESLRPWWAEALRVEVSHGEGGAALAVQDCDSLTVLLADGNAYRYAQSHALIGMDVQMLIDRALIAANWATDTVRVIQIALDDGHLSSSRKSKDTAVFAQRTVT